MDLLGQQLIQKGLITQEQLEEALSLQKTVGGRMGKILQKMGALEEETFARFLAEEYGHEYLKPEQVRADSKLIAQYDEDEMHQHMYFPLHRTIDKLEIAITDPTDLEIYDDLGLREERPVELKVVSARTVERVLRKIFEREEEEKQKVKKQGAWKKAPGAELLHAIAGALIEKGLLTDEDLDRQLKS